MLLVQQLPMYFWADMLSLDLQFKKGIKMTNNIIPSDKAQEKRMGNPGKNNQFVGSREGGPLEHSRTKMKSIKHSNPEFFKRQSDRKNADQNGFQQKQFSKGTNY
jgi:hypothetical protein